MTCGRCAAEDVTASGWCVDCERLCDEWNRQHAADIIWQAFTGAGIAMVFALGAPLLGLSMLLGIAGVLLGAGTSVGLRLWTKRRRRQQFLATSMPRAYLPAKT
jgi:Flp pilus assembly protein TadB